MRESPISNNSCKNRLASKKAEFKDRTRTRKAVHLTMVTSFGVRRNAYADSVQSFVTLDDLFR